MTRRRDHFPWPGYQRPWTKALIVTFLLCVAHLDARAQTQDRIAQEIDSREVVSLKGSIHPLAQPQYDVGIVDPSAEITGVSLYFKPSPAQQADLGSLLAEQQTPTSPNYHRWLTPAEYANRFGMTVDDLTKVQTWLQSQGLQIDDVSASGNRITFSGSAGQIASLLHTELHHYQIRGQDYIANATELSIPVALSGIVTGVRNLADFRPRPKRLLRTSPRYTGGGGSHFLAPNDFTTIYDVKAQYNAGYTGAGETIVVVGQSAIEAGDVANFRRAAGLPSNTPTFTLVPGTGDGTVTDSSGDEDESDLDVEWSGAIAKQAAINFVYVGNNQNDSVFDALQYAIENNLAPVISISYGACEADNSQSSELALQTVFEQASSQGQTIVAAAGDDGAADCDYSATGPGGSTIVNGDEATKGLAVDFPGSSPNVTSVGGSEFNEGSGDYWNGSNGSATGYIPEKVWNDTSKNNGIAAGGGGKSIVFGKPSWQTGNGVPKDGARDVPDIAINASAEHDSYLVCASGADSTSCSNGFADNGGQLTIFGGTSFGAPTFSGELTLINQQLASGGQGNVNPLLYVAAAASPDAFHDIIVGNNDVPCEAGSPNCSVSGEFGYSATSGYDLASGWGSVDLYNLAQALAAQTSTGSTKIGTTTIVTGTTTTPIAGLSVTFTATVQSDSGTTAPTGTVQFAVNGADAGGPVALAGGAATYSTSFTATGFHTITASYSGDTTHSSSTGTLGVTVASSATFTLSATDVTISSGSSGTSTITVTPSGGYKGTVAFTASLPSALSSDCYTATSAVVTGTGAVTATVTIDTDAKDCTTAGRHPFSSSPSVRRKSASTRGMGVPGKLGGLGAALASVFLLGFSRRRRGMWPVMLSLIFLGVLTFGAGCGGSGGSNEATTTSTNTQSTSCPITVTGTDSANNISTSTTFTLTVE